MNLNVFDPSGMPDVRGGKGMIHTQTFRGKDSFIKPRFLETVLTRFPGGSVQLSALIDRMARKSTTSFELGFRIQNVRYPTLTLTADMAPATRLQSSTIKVSDTSMLLPNMIFVAAPYGEQLMITSIPGANEIVVIRGMGTVPAFGAKAGTQLQFAGNAFEEGSLRPLGTFTHQERMHTQTQIFRNGWATTETMHVVATAAGVPVNANSKRAAGYDHGVDIESAVLFGQQSNTIRNGQPMRTFSGVLDFVRYNAPQNIINVDGHLNYDDLCAIFDMFGDVQVGPNPSDMRIIYGDKTFVNAIHAIGRKYADLLRMTTDNQDSFGQRFRSFVTPRMRFDVYEHPIFSTRKMPKGMAFVVDPSTMELHYLRDTNVTYFNADENGAIQKFTSDNGVDARGGDFLSELGFVMTNPAANGVIYGVKGARCNDNC